MANCWCACGASWARHCGGANNASQLIEYKYMSHKYKYCQLSAAPVYLLSSFCWHNSICSCWCQWWWVKASRSRAGGLVESFFPARCLQFWIVWVPFEGFAAPIYNFIYVCACICVLCAMLVNFRPNMMGKINSATKLLTWKFFFTFLLLILA